MNVPRFGYILAAIGRALGRFGGRTNLRHRLLSKFSGVKYFPYVYEDNCENNLTNAVSGSA